MLRPTIGLVLPPVLSRAPEPDLVTDLHGGEPELRHHQPEFDFAAGHDIVWQHGCPRPGGPAHGGVRSTRLERVGCGRQVAGFAQENGERPRGELKGDPVVEDPTGWHVGTVLVVGPVHRGAAG